MVREPGVPTSVQNIISQAKVHDVAGLRVLLRQSNAALRELGFTLGQVKQVQLQLEQVGQGWASYLSSWIPSFRDEL
jgi:hypothetical protein